jgi:predicted lipid-binding transport protein (Tim44 family)
MANSQLLDILLFAMVAAFLLFRLYSVLGRRTGNEREVSDRFRRIGGAPGGAATALPAAPAIAAPADPVARGLLDIKLADTGFETEKFLSGARQAYQIVITAYADGDRGAMRPLVSDDVYAVFDGAIGARDARHEKVAFTFAAFNEVKIVHAIVKDRRAEITVQFTAQFTSVTTDAAGAVVEGDAQAVRDVHDVWTFARTVGAADPNWTLVATGGPEAL